MPNMDVSDLNTVIAVLGAFIIIFGIISVKIKSRWFLGEALPAVLIGIILGPILAKFLDSLRWGSSPSPEQTSTITLGLTRIMIRVQLVIAGYQVPAKYQLLRWKEMALCLLPIMTVMWLCTTLCMLATVPDLSLLSALVIASCVTCTDPILSQAIAKGPFADKFVARDLRKIISSEAGANDGFGFPFLMLAVYLMRHANSDGSSGGHGAEAAAEVVARIHRPDFMPNVCKNYKEAFFMGYFGPIGAGAVFYVEHTRHLYPELGHGDEEETHLVRVMISVVYVLVLFSIVVHGLSIPGLNLIYKFCGVKPIMDDAVVVRRKSVRVPTPVIAEVNDSKTFVAYNRFSRPVFEPGELPVVEERYGGGICIMTAVGRRRLIRSSLRRTELRPAVNVIALYASVRTGSK
ncbi:unnamed protein product [Sordaria macrospora k-hell]|uniref:WGS project CABT00000000 data, contig 2.27 n=1 Tax=Sordaria macrospora (strain ATCC MYA-333 / DSM 997 / K(L3346) / K-hell) TaxID=771870 RepID=F7W4I8_SORMK|nr:uncharacterized protein SMAC_07661 [Sordaria macrospora k-hell]CCC14941.1 unnamed protein product [Sordaria macrospora k-hell]